MPVTISPISPAVFTPWVNVVGSSDFIGPLPVGSKWVFDLTNVGGETVVWHATQTSQSLAFSVRLFDRTTVDPVSVSDQVVATGTQLQLVAHLEDNVGNVLDQGVSQQLPWEPTAGMPTQIFNQPTGQPGGGLTPEQATQLTNIDLAVSWAHLIDNLTLIPLTNGPSGDFVGEAMVEPVFGVIVRLANIPLELTPQTPDGDYWVSTLAVVRIFRGSDLWERVPIHTSSKMIPLPVNWIQAAISQAFFTDWPLRMSLQVTFLPGVTGEVFLMRLP